MAEPVPPLTVGLPVYNGAQFVGMAIESILAQTYKDFELLISDNASADSTEAICRTYVEKDNRVRYVRNKTNIGAAPNYNRLLEASESPYFKWAAHDDVLVPEYLARCIEVLDHRPSVVVCHTETVYIDEDGATCGTFDDRLDLCSPRPHERYRDYLFRPYPRCNAIFGVIRMTALRQTPLFGSYSSSDRVLLGELALRGEIYRVPEPLFLRRDHPHQAWKANPTRESREAWFDPARKGKITFPSWRLLLEHARAVMRVPMDGYERLLCLRQLGTWMRQNDGRLVRDLLLREQ
jgi:glycosyltransferase involved in cell wall biosynthesis